MNVAAVSAFAAVFAALVSAGTLAWNAYQYNQTAQAQQREELMQQRRGALLAALQVIDHVYSNEPLVNGHPSNPHEWPLQSARDADILLRIYCQFPETRKLFFQALGFCGDSRAAQPLRGDSTIA